MNKFFYFIKHKESGNSGSFFDVKLLESFYIDISKFHNNFVESYITKLSKVLKERIPGYEIRNVGKKVTAFSTLTADALISESITEFFDFYQLFNFYGK